MQRSQHATQLYRAGGDLLEQFGELPLGLLRVGPRDPHRPRALPPRRQLHTIQTSSQQSWRGEAAPGRRCWQQRPCSASVAGRQVGAAGSGLRSSNGSQSHRRACAHQTRARLPVDRVAAAAAAPKARRMGSGRRFERPAALLARAKQTRTPGGWPRQAPTVDGTAGAEGTRPAFAGAD